MPSAQRWVVRNAHISALSTVDEWMDEQMDGHGWMDGQMDFSTFLA